MGKSAIVTGGSSGLGLSIANLLKDSGYSVIVWDRSPCEAHHYIHCDVSDSTSIKAALTKSLELFQSFDVLVNSAGIGVAISTISRSSVHDLSSFSAVLQVNLIGLFDVTRSVSQYMHGGVIINIASMAATEGQRGQVAYSASKAAVASMTMPMARDLASRSTRIVCLCPGVFETPMSSLISPSVKAKISKGIALGRLGTPEELSHIVKMCIENTYLNGCNINIHGGGILPNI